MQKELDYTRQRLWKTLVPSVGSYDTVFEGDAAAFPRLRGFN